MKTCFFQSFVLSFCLCQSAGAETLTLFTWEAYLAPEIKNQFETETGINIRELHFSSDEGRNQLLWSGYPKYLDLVLMDSLSLRDKSWNEMFINLPADIRNNSNIDERFSTRCGLSGAPYMWGGIGIAYRTSQITKPITSWKQLFDPEPALKGRIAMMDDAYDNVSVALKSVGYSINTQNEDELRAAYRQLLHQRDYVARYALSFDAIADAKVGPKIAAAMTYSGDYYVLKERSPFKDWVYVTPEEGTALWMDCFAILKSSEHISAAQRFLNFLNRPDIANRNGELLGFTPALKTEKLSPTITKNHISYPPVQQLSRSEFYDAQLAHDELRISIYYAVKK